MLENILIKYFDLKDDYEEKNWYNAYNKLISLIYDLGEGGIIPNPNEIVDKLDKIDSEDF